MEGLDIFVSFCLLFFPERRCTECDKMPTDFQEPHQILHQNLVLSMRYEVTIQSRACRD